MRDCLIIVPTRRPEGAHRLATAVQATATARTDLVFCVDDDDTRDYDVPGAEIVRGPRQDCIRWTNQIALERVSGYRAVASFGDDHEPKTLGWDTALLAAIGWLGGTGIAYGNDTLQGARLPTAPVVSSGIVAAFRFLMLPIMARFYCDDWWRDVAAPDLLAYIPEVVIKHHHYLFGTAPRDELYAASERFYDSDRAVYEAYCKDPDGLTADRSRLRELARRSADMRPRPAVDSAPHGGIVHAELVREHTD